MRFLPWNDLAGGRGGASDRHDGGRAASSPCRARAASGRRRPSSCSGAARAVPQSGARCSSLDEVQCGLGPHGQALRLPARGHHARHPDPGQAAGRRPAHGRGPPARGPGGRDRPRGRPRQHVRRQPGGGGRVPGRARPAHRARLRRRRRQEGRLPAARAAASCARASPGAIAEVRGLGLMVGVEFTGEAGPGAEGRCARRASSPPRRATRCCASCRRWSSKPAEIKEFLAALDEPSSEQAGVAFPSSAGRRARSTCRREQAGERGDEPREEGRPGLLGGARHLDHHPLDQGELRRGRDHRLLRRRGPGRRPRGGAQEGPRHRRLQVRGRGPARGVRPRLRLQGPGRGRRLRGQLPARHRPGAAAPRLPPGAGAPSRRAPTRWPTAPPARATTRCASR